MNRQTIGWGTLIICSMLGACSQSSEKRAQDSQVSIQTSISATPNQVQIDTARTSVIAGSTVTGKAAVKAFIDPVTGEMRQPTEEELKAIASKETKLKQTETVKTPATTRPQEIVLPDGTIGTKVEQSSEESLQGCIQKDGNLVISHACNNNTSSANGAKQ